MLKKCNFDDKELLALIKGGDEIALKALYQRYWKPLFASVYGILRDQQVCEDIIQDIFITVWNKRQEIEIKASLKSYLFASARYEVFRQIRHGSVREDIFDQVQDRLHSSPEYGSLEHKELVGQIKSVVDVLPEKCRQVYKLSREEQLSHKEIANQLHISTKTVENHLNKALKQLRSALAYFI